MTNNPDHHRQLLVLLTNLGSPTELEAVLQTLSAACSKMADKVSGKYPSSIIYWGTAKSSSIAYWGTAKRLIKQAQSELKEIRTP